MKYNKQYTIRHNKQWIEIEYNIIMGYNRSQCDAMYNMKQWPMNTISYNKQ